MIQKTGILTPSSNTQTIERPPSNNTSRQNDGLDEFNAARCAFLELTAPLDGSQPKKPQRIVDGISPATLSQALQNRWAVGHAAIGAVQLATMSVPARAAGALLLSCAAPHAQAALLGLHIGLTLGVTLVGRWANEWTENQWRGSLYEGRRQNLVKALNAEPKLRNNHDFVELAGQELGHQGMLMDDKVVTTALTLFAIVKPLAFVGMTLAVACTPTTVLAMGGLVGAALAVNCATTWLTTHDHANVLEQQKAEIVEKSDALADRLSFTYGLKAPAWEQQFKEQSKKYQTFRLAHESNHLVILQLQQLPVYMIDSAAFIERQLNEAATNISNYKPSAFFSHLSASTYVFDAVGHAYRLNQRAQSLDAQIKQHQKAIKDSLVKAK